MNQQTNTEKYTDLYGLFYFSAVLSTLEFSIQFVCWSVAELYYSKTKIKTPLSICESYSKNKNQQKRRSLKGVHTEHFI